MSRYYSVSKNTEPNKMYYDDDIWPAESFTMDVLETESIDTGLYDKDGRPIYRMMDKIGFL